MKRTMYIYDYCKLPIRVAFFAIFLIGFGFLITNDSVNIFYTFKSSILINFAGICLKIGEMIIINLPLIFMVNIVCKKANSGVPIVMSLIGYITFLVTMMLFGNQNLGNSAYLSSSIINMEQGRLPFQTGLISSFIVGYLIRIAYIYSRNRSSHTIFILFNKDTVSIIYSMFLCFIAGLLISYAYPIAFSYIQKLISYIAIDLMDPMRIAIYGFFDRLFSLFGLGNIIRNPFWFTAAGGSYSNTITGQAILGDVNIWSYLKDNATSYFGAGRFITPYYIINMFIIPGMYLGILMTMSDKQERHKHLGIYIFGALLSFIVGNPLPFELLLLFTSPLLLIIYLLMVGGLFALLVKQNIFLGFVMNTNNITVAMPGSFPDFIINIRNFQYNQTVMKIALYGLGFFVLAFIITQIYYRFLAYDIFKTGKLNKISNDLIIAMGGIDNIESCGSGLFRLRFYLNNLEAVSIEKIKAIGARRMSETRNGISIEFGSSSHIIGKKIMKLKKARN